MIDEAVEKTRQRGRILEPISIDINELTAYSQRMCWPGPVRHGAMGNDVMAQISPLHADSTLVLL